MEIAEVYDKFFFDCTSKYAVLYGGAGSGKSYTAAQKIVYRMCSEDGHKFLIIRKVAATLRHSVFALFKNIIDKEELSELFKINESNLEITYLPNGNKAIFKGLDDPEKIKSIDGITSMWIEEATELTEVETPHGKKSDFDQLDLRLRGKSKHYKQIIITFNPVSANHWIKQKFFDNAPEDCYTLKTTYLDNPFIDDEYRQTMERLRSQNEEYYKIYALGEWGSLEGIIYKEYETVERLPEYFEDEFVGLDFGYNHPFAIVHVRIDGKNLYVDELIYERDKSNNEIIEKIEKEYPFVKNIQIYADSARPDLISDWRDSGFIIDKANKSVFDGINTVKSFKLHVTRNSHNIKKELELYAWKTDKSGKTLDEPVKLNDDAMDALRYALTPYIEKHFRMPKKMSFKIGV